MRDGSVLERRLAISRTPNLTGLDYIELAASRDPDRPRVLLHFVPSAPGVARRAVPAGISPETLRIQDRSGAPTSGIRVAGVSPENDSVLAVELRVDPDARLAAAQGEAYVVQLPALPWIDPFFRARPFWLAPAPPPSPSPRARAMQAPPDGTAAAPEIDYLVKDYASFRTTMLDQLTLLAPTWTEQGPADMGMAIVEALAYAADYLSYEQDAVATEAYLATARQRISIRRHARLLGYALHEGCNARCWAQFTIDGDDPVQLPTGTQLLTGTPAPNEARLVPANSRVHSTLLNQGAEVFETLYPATLRKAHNRFSIYTWGVSDWSLPAGSTRLSVEGHVPDLQPGDVLMLEATGADPRLRHAVRLSTPPELSVDPLYGDGDGVAISQLEWSAADALPFELPVSTSRDGRRVTDLAVVYGNVVLADHGRTVGPEWLDVVPSDGAYRPTLHQPHLVYSQPLDTLDGELARSAPASLMLVQDPRQALPAVSLVEQDGASRTIWQPQPDLLRSNGFASDFVVEVDNRSHARLRFGDGVLGKQPTPGTRFSAIYRVEGGPRGDIDADSLGYVVGGDPRLVAVRNPLPAQPGLAPEAIDDARTDAPQMLTLRQTCVSEADYSAAAKQHPEVTHAVTRLLWSGSSYVACIYVQRRHGQPVDGAFSLVLERFLEPRLLAGLSVEIRAPHLVPLWIKLRVEVDATTYRSSVQRALDELARAYFDPDRFTFGQPVYLSPLVRAVAGVAGVVSVDWLEHGRFQRWGKPAGGELEAGCISLGPLEIARAANAPGAPSLGSVEFDVRGGR